MPGTQRNADSCEMVFKSRVVAYHINSLPCCCGVMCSATDWTYPMRLAASAAQKLHLAAWFRRVSTRRISPGFFGVPHPTVCWRLESALHWFLDVSVRSFAASPNINKALPKRLLFVAAPQIAYITPTPPKSGCVHCMRAAFGPAGQGKKR